MSNNNRVDTEADLGEVRHSINVEKLTQYLTDRSPQHFVAPFVVKQFGYGQSNPSYQLVDAKGRKYVLRKQPPGALLAKSAHRVDREFHMIKSLREATNVPVPRVLVLCQDKNVIGTDFYIMEFVSGRIFHSPAFPELSSQGRKECWLSAINTLAQLHRVDPSKIGLPEAFTKNMSSHYPRQVVTLSRIEEAQSNAVDKDSGEKVGHIPDFEYLTKWMKQNMPPSRVSIVHGDYKIDNLIFHPTENRVIAILDWELCTIGHPLADLGNILQPYTLPDFGKGQGSGGFKGTQLLPGVPSLENQLQCYKQASGWDPQPYWSFAVVYSHLRLAVITHGIAARLARGQASSANAKRLAVVYPLLSGLAMEEISSDGTSKL
jgi:aminoglycoside phosphotransferase (APT) family kinase protein